MASKKNPPASEGASDTTDEQVVVQPPNEELADAQITDLNADSIKAAGGEDKGMGEDKVPGKGVLVPNVAPPAPEAQPEVTYDVAPLDPLDSSEAWKEQNFVGSGDADSGRETKDGHRAGQDSKASPGDTTGDLDAIKGGESIEARAAAYQTISTRKDGTLTQGLQPDAVVQVPEDVPAPINPLSDSTAVQDRVLYENWVNSEAEAFANEARIRFINATVAGKTLTLSGDERDDEEADAGPDAGTPVDDGKLENTVSEDGTTLTPKS